MSGTALVPIDQIVAALAAQALPLCQHLLAAGVREGAEWRVGSLAGEAGRSMAVHLHGSRAGIWSDFSTGETGDALDLVAQCLFAGDKAQALKWSRAWLALDSAAPAPIVRKAVPPPDESRKNREAARRIWLSAQERVAGTPVDRYLRGRGIDLAELERQPRAIKFHPALWNTEAKQKFPAMVATITNHEGSLIACHRTWLAVQSDGRVTKVPGLKEPKKTIGSFKGGAIRLWRGASMKPLRDAPIGETVVLTEGIEDALSIALACPQHRIMAAVSLGNLGNLVLPRSVETVIIAADNDDDNEQATKGLNRAIARFTSEGREVRIARSPIGKDFNDCLQGVA
ncbi:MAG TPA: toprim domain-containing protein [Alphaproteobacteria bacterium]|nr:toprim domain-containing protein [Alphaproteobacteria bacterium]